ncbi:hypothetical protein T01_13498 [Trichinella spiralis]|uniref:Uncharacterized protein n=1 Tax=Trichinella spiralis TaxID=6334 RepID=A0A0V1BQE0_TRISP|nr:hypothetical protein T01_13498 [Trichinella spiralis]
MLFNATKCVFVLQNSTNDAPREERQPKSVNLFVISVTVLFSVNTLLFSPGCWFETSLKDQKCDFATVFSDQTYGVTDVASTLILDATSAPLWHKRKAEGGT